MAMRRRDFLVTCAAGVVLPAAATAALPSTETRTTAPMKNGYARVNGLKLYYEIHGAGAPLVLLHGGVGSTEIFSDIMPTLSSSRQVIAVDLQAHGRTADIDRPLSFEAMADDIATLVRDLGISKADVMGYSLGGGVALRIAIQHPDVVKKLLVVSALANTMDGSPRFVRRWRRSVRHRPSR